MVNSYKKLYSDGDELSVVYCNDVANLTCVPNQSQWNKFTLILKINFLAFKIGKYY